MTRVKYTTETVYIAEPERWDELKNSPSSVSQEMYRDLLMVNSGALMLSEHIAALVSDTKSKSVTFLYPEVDTVTVRDELHYLLRNGSKEGVIFKNTFRFAVVDVASENGKVIGLKVSFIEK